MEHFYKLIKKKKGQDIRKDVRAVQKLRREVEKAKRALSSAHQTSIEIESLYEGVDFSETLTRAKFEELNMVRQLFLSQHRIQSSITNMKANIFRMVGLDTNKPV
jgi:molecular chaperone DnaK (HSP70)